MTTAWNGRRAKAGDHGGPVRVPDPTVGFWVTKAASTALGEAVSDFSIRVMPPVLAVLLGFACFVLALASAAPAPLRPQHLLACRGHGRRLRHHGC